MKLCDDRAHVEGRCGLLADALGLIRRQRRVLEARAAQDADDPLVGANVATLDQTGVGQLMQIAVEKGRSSRPKIKLGICGEHGGDPESVKFCHRLGLDYVSCSPFRVPIARLAAAQAAIAE